MASPTPTQQTPYPQTGSYTENGSAGSTANRTGVALSTMILIKVGLTNVGAVQSLTISEERTITPIDEVGTDGHIDSAPTKSSNVSGTCKRTRFDRLRISEAFSRGFLHVKSQRIPFDIEIIDQYNGEANSDSVVVTVISNVWIKSLAYSYTSDNWIISDDMGWDAETIYSYVGSPNNPAAQGGERNVPLQYDPYELAADVGMRRGSMDAPGLISAAFSAA